MRVWFDVCDVMLLDVLESLTFSAIDLGIAVIPHQPKLQMQYTNSNHQTCTYMNQATKRTKHSTINKSGWVAMLQMNLQNTERPYPSENWNNVIFGKDPLNCSSFWGGWVVWCRYNNSPIIIKSRSGPVLVTNEPSSNTDSVWRGCLSLQFFIHGILRWKHVGAS